LFGCLGSWHSLSGRVRFAFARLSLQRFTKLSSLPCFVKRFLKVFFLASSFRLVYPLLRNGLNPKKI
ncbi:hypothetical protein, partial [Pseudanabaena sp. UWO311]|uniref:hypothetical protein n=1 Tax=Pseudanabaena sp. UWO311 TaxID=2487337 RepID=UPI001CC1F7DA